MQVENNDSIKEYYVKLHNMYKNAVNMLTAINQSLSTKASEITIDLANTDNTTTTVRIPSFLYLENKIEQLDNNFSNLFDMPNSGEAWFSKSSNMYKLKMIKSNVAPLAPEFSTNNIYASLKEMFPDSSRTIRNWINRGYLNAKRIDLRKQARHDVDNRECAILYIDGETVQKSREDSPFLLLKQQTNGVPMINFKSCWKPQY